MRRSNTRKEHLAMLISSVAADDIEAAIGSYLDTADSKAWMKKLRSSKSRRYFLIRDGDALDAKAIAKYALRANDLPFADWHTDPLIDLLEHLGFPIWDVDRDGDYDRRAARQYEISRRLARPGQQKFRRNALAMWKGRCPISGVKVEEALEAAHISPHAKRGKMTAKNSIVLRADLHRLFDAHLMAIDPKTLCVKFKNKMKSYADLAETKVKLPKNGPSAKAFLERWEVFSSS